MSLRLAHHTVIVSSLAAIFPVFGAARGGCGDGPINSRSPAPDVDGVWDIAYDDVIGVRVTLGGAVYTAEIGVGGGEVTIEHGGHPFTFALDCSRPEVVCPSEVWPTTVTLSQRNATYPHHF